MESRGKRYTDEEQTIWVEMAQEIGIARTIRELGYPSFSNGMLWLKKRGVEVERSDIMAVARQYNQLYKTEDMLNVIDAGIGVAEELIATAETPDDVKKISEAIAKLVNTRLLLEGKANSISESRKASPVDLEIMALIDEQRKVNDMHDANIANAENHK